MSAVVIERTQAYLHLAMALLGPLLLLGTPPEAARGQLPPDFRDVPAAKLKKDSVRIEPGGSIRGLERAPAQVRSPDRRRIARVQTLSTGLESRGSRIVISRPGPSPDRNRCGRQLLRLRLVA